MLACDLPRSVQRWLKSTLSYLLAFNGRVATWGRFAGQSTAIIARSLEKGIAWSGGMVGANDARRSVRAP